MVTGIGITRHAGEEEAGSRRGGRHEGKEPRSPRLHLLAGCRNLLAPAPLPSEEIVRLLGKKRVQGATAFWLSARCGPFYHDFLLEAEGDTRVAVFARSLTEDFGSRVEPLVVLPTLIAEATGALPPAHGMRGAPGVLLEILRSQPSLDLVLHAFALPASVDADGSWAGSAELLAPQARGRLDGLRASLAAEGQDPGRIRIRVTEASRKAPGFEALLRNALSCEIAKRLAPDLATAGLGVDFPQLETAIARILANWSAAGQPPAPSLGASELDRLSERVSMALPSFVQVFADA